MGVSTTGRNLTRGSLAPSAIVESQVTRDVVVRAFDSYTGGTLGFSKLLCLSTLSSVVSFLCRNLRGLTPRYKVFAATTIRGLLCRPDEPPGITVRIGDRSHLLSIAFDASRVGIRSLGRVIERVTRGGGCRHLSGKGVIGLHRGRVGRLASTIIRLSMPLGSLGGRVSLPLCGTFNISAGTKIIRRSRSFVALVGQVREPRGVSFRLPRSLATALHPCRRAKCG